MKRFVVRLDMNWVLSKREEDVLPAAVVAQALQQEGCAILSQNFTVVAVEIPAKEADHTRLQELVLEKLKKKYEMTEEELKAVVKVTVENAPDEEKKPEEKKAPETKPAGTPRSEPCRETFLADLAELEGAKEFVSLCQKIHTLAPLLRKQELCHILTCRSYLFSVDDGGGLTTALRILNKLLREQQLFILRGEPVELKLAPPNKGEDPLAEAARHIVGAQGKLVCVDISNWMDKLTTTEFRDFLNALETNRNRAIYVFRVPYLEKEALNRIDAALSDVLLVDSVSFVPLTQEEFQRIAQRKLKMYGFTADEAAWELFRKRLAEEKSDGRFYGTKTAKNVVDEMVFFKLQEILSSGNEDQVIKAADLPGFVRQESKTAGADQLSGMIGVTAIRQRLEEIMAQIEFARKTQGVQAPAMHMRFVGNPGTGKTTVARIVGQMLKERGLLSKGYFFEHSGGDFVGMYVGHTAPKTLAICRDAYGSVLFIDEAYTLADMNYSSGSGYAKEAIDTLIAQMENHRHDMVVIMAGYPREMERLMALNPGLAGRMPYELVFPNYTPEELGEIYLSMAAGDGFTLGEGVEEAVRHYFKTLSRSVLEDPNFSNARFVRNVFERTWSKTVMRTQLDGTDSRTITLADFKAATVEDVRVPGRTPRPGRPGYRLGMI